MNKPDQLHRNCPLCGQGGPEPFMQKGDLQIVRCRECSMLYANPVASDLASGAFYERRDHYLAPDKLAGDYAPVRFERETRVFRKWCQAGAVLDVGCSTGAFLRHLKTLYPSAYEVMGLDVPGPALDYAESRGIAVRRENFLELDLGGNQFDAVTFWAVLEHVLQPGEFLGTAARNLKPGGHCLVLVPNMRSLAVRLLGRKYRYVTPEHLNYFTAPTLRRLAERQQDLEIVDASSSHFNPVVIWQDLRSGGREVPDAERAQLLKRTTAWKQSRILKPIKWVYASVEKTLGSMHLADNLYLVLRKHRPAKPITQDDGT